MTITIDLIAQAFESAGLHVEPDGEHALGGRFTTRRYVAPGTDSKSIVIIVTAADDGKFVHLFAPRAFVLDSGDVAAALETCMRFQWDYRLVRFEFDANDGELRPSVHIPVLDGTLTPGQIVSSCRLLVDLVDRIAPSIRAALDAGVVMPHNRDMTLLTERLAALRPDELELLLAAVTGPESVPA